ncbi:MAG: thioredoxin family protein [Myxococcota bacterium]
MHSKGLEPGTPAPDFNLPGVDGRKHALGDFDEAKVLVVIFTCNHCPYAKASEDRFVAIQRDYAGRGVQLVAINPNDAEAYPDDSFERMKQRAEEKGFNFPYLRDESQQVARAYDAACTPDIFVFDRDRRLVANTRLDDNTKQPDQVTRQDLREIIDANLEGKRLPFDPKPSVGCSIKWKPRR